MLSEKYRNYNYVKMRNDIDTLKNMYDFIEISVIGESVWGSEIINVDIGAGKEGSVHFNASHHALEWITSALLIQFLFDFCGSLEKNEGLLGYDTRRILNNVSMSFVPMVNPDGIKMVTEGIPFKGVDAEFVRNNWQSNANGVDLNHNYDAGFYAYKRIAAKEGYNKPMHTRYPGRNPLDQPETRALARHIAVRKFDISTAFHSQGEEIYYEYNGRELPLSGQIARRLGAVSGYSVCETEGLSSYSGFKDWVIDKLVRYGYTIEVGKGKNPLPIEQLDKLYVPNAKLILEIASITFGLSSIQ